MYLNISFHNGQQVQEIDQSNPNGNCDLHHLYYVNVEYIALTFDHYITGLLI